ncbi:MAG: exopolyphosphatase [Fibrobacter sp.]|nr:exopolyphosphatase [Fibrobacter sp.]
MKLSGKYRLITRSDLDGVAAAALLQDRGYIESILFTHPKDIQDGTISVGNRDILVNLPYMPGCAIAFDRSGAKLNADAPNLVSDSAEGSVARLVYTWLGGRLSFPRIDQEMLNAVDKSVLANYTETEVIDPQNWSLIAFLLDARTGLGRFKDFRLSNYQLMHALIPLFRNLTVQDILQNPDVAERVEIYREHQDRSIEQLRRCTQVHGKVAVVDLRDEEVIWAGNRFLVYALFPQIEVSIHAIWGLRRQNTVFALGKSIINKESAVHLGNVAAQFNGGGHSGAGTCQVSHEKAAETLTEILAQLHT